MVLLILLLQIFIYTDVFSSGKINDVNQPELLAFQSQIDSLKAIEIENRKPKIYPFNPNYITDYKGEQLGMSLMEIDRLLAFRKTNKFVNSKNEFQKVTKVSDSLLDKISTYFKFPDWVVKRSEQNAKSSITSTKVKNSYLKKTISTTPKVNWSLTFLETPAWITPKTSSL